MLDDTTLKFGLDKWIGALTFEMSHGGYDIKMCVEYASC